MEEYKTRQNQNTKKALMGLYLVVVLLFIGQLLYILHSNSQIRYEELAESVRNVFWLDEHTIYDGVSSNVGWYGTVLIIYKVFGFSLHASKYYRLLLFLVSIVCTAIMLNKYIGAKRSLVPLIAIGLSPTLIFFNTLQTSYGLDMMYLLICVYLIDVLDFTKKIKSVILQVLLGFTAMLALMSYPIFGFALPPLLLFYFIKLWSIKSTKIRNIVTAAISFLFPLIAVLVYVKDRPLLLFDSVTGSGIFRGAGTFTFNINTLFSNLVGFVNDLFIKGGSYYYDLRATEFSNYYPIISAILVLVLSVWIMIKVKKYRVIMGLIWILFLTNLIFGNLATDPSTRPGIRRNTGVLMAFYGLYVFSWFYITTATIKNYAIRCVAIIILLLIPLHHLFSYLPNYASFSTLSVYRYGFIYTALETPAKSLEYFTKLATVNDVPLGCKDPEGNLVTCRYSESYAAIAGACRWNKLECKQILGYDQKTNQYIPLSIKLWETYYWDH